MAIISKDLILAVDGEVSTAGKDYTWGIATVEVNNVESEIVFTKNTTGNIKCQYNNNTISKGLDIISSTNLKSVTLFDTNKLFSTEVGRIVSSFNTSINGNYADTILTTVTIGNNFVTVPLELTTSSNATIVTLSGNNILNIDYDSKKYNFSYKNGVFLKDIQLV